MHTNQAADVVSTIKRRHAELFGFIATERAAIRLIRSEKNMVIVKCRLEQLDNLLVTIALSEPAAVTLGMSGSIKRLRKSIQSAVVLMRL
jgi:RNase P/RNase MRP subunit POP5